MRAPGREPRRARRRRAPRRARRRSSPWPGESWSVPARWNLVTDSQASRRSCHLVAARASALILASWRAVMFLRPCGVARSDFLRWSVWCFFCLNGANRCDARPSSITGVLSGTAEVSTYHAVRPLRCSILRARPRSFLLAAKTGLSESKTPTDRQLMRRRPLSRRKRDLTRDLRRRRLIFLIL